MVLYLKAELSTLYDESGFVFGERGCKRTGSSQKEKILQAALDLIVYQAY